MQDVVPKKEDEIMGKKLTIYMLDGIPTGPKTVEIGNWSGKAIYSPRSGLKNILERQEYENPGVYFLKSESPSKDFIDSVYIGEAEELKKRLKQHIADRDFESVLCFISKDEMLTKAHIKYIESRLISIGREAQSSNIENSNQPKLPKISEADISDMEYFIEQITLVLPTVGIQTLVSTITQADYPQESDISKQIIYNIKSKSINAQMIESENGFVVHKNSECSLKTSKSISEGRIRIRNKLIENKILQKKGNKFIFTEDIEFSSPSAASSVVLGRQAAGPVSWVDKKGKTYKENQQGNQ